jgi:ribosomal-protein-alanine N-acetyltransferase
MPPRLEIKDGIYLSPVRLADRRALANHERTKGIHEAISTASEPLRETMAQTSRGNGSVATRTATYFTEVARALWSHARAPDNAWLFAVRNPAGTLIGTVGTNPTHVHNPVCGDLRGWILPAFWRQGIMTIVLRVFSRYAFDELGLLKLSATVFESNTAVARVLEKNGFTLEGRLRKHFMQDGKLVDAYIYGLLQEEFDAHPKADGS